MQGVDVNGVNIGGVLVLPALAVIATNVCLEHSPMAPGILSAKGGAFGLVNAVERGCCASGRVLLHGTWTEVVEPSLGSTAPMPADRYRQQSPS